MNVTHPSFLLLSAALLATTTSAQDGRSTFGHARSRALADLERLPSPADVAVVDLIDYHRHRLPLPRAGETIALDARFGSPTATRDGKAVLQVGIATAPVGDPADLPPINLVLVIDKSGSMGDHGKLDEVKRALQTLAERLRPADRIAIVAYSDAAEILVPSRPRDDGRWLRAEVARLEPGGSTNLHAGLMLGLREATEHRLENGSNRVMLLTDGIANQGETDAREILADARLHTDCGIDLSTIGVGTELNTELLDELARGARGMFHFVGDVHDVTKVFVRELESSLTAVARDVSLEIDLPDGVHVERVYGHRAEQRDGRVVLRLADFGAEATSVVLVECRLRAARTADGSGVEVAARLSFREAVSGRSRELVARARIDGCADERREQDGHGALADAEVRKNYTIAVLAQAMHEMAEHAAAARWADAERSLARGQRFAREHFPSGDDPDVERVFDISEGYRKALCDYVDRFRDGD